MTVTETRITVAEERAQKAERIKAGLDARTDALLEVLPSKMGVERFKRVVALAISKNPELYDCTLESLLRAILEAAQDGLEPTGPSGGAHLVPFRSSGGVLEAVLIRDYRGLLKMALRGEVSDIEYGIVHEGDFLELEKGSTPHVRFIPVRDGAERGNYQGIYTLLRFKDRSVPEHVEYQTIADINKVRDSTRGAGKRGPWADWYDEMVVKTAVRHALKLRATTPEMYEALAREDAVETAWDEPVNIHPSVERRERLIARIAPERQGTTETAATTAAAPEGQTFEVVGGETFTTVTEAESMTAFDRLEAEVAAIHEERDPITCGDLSPIDGAACDQPLDHAGVHRAPDQTWPR